jgi:hypothetical protein
LTTGLSSNSLLPQIRERWIESWSDVTPRRLRRGARRRPPTSIGAPEHEAPTLLTPLEYTHAGGSVFSGERGKIASNTMQPNTALPSARRPQV